jgi:hypothetical protein
VRDVAGAATGSVGRVHSDAGATGGDAEADVIDWTERHVEITVRDDGPKCYKQYTRGGKKFWRNYKRDVPGGVSFIERFDAIAQTTIRAYRQRLTEQLWPTSTLSASSPPPPSP